MHSSADEFLTMINLKVSFLLLIVKLTRHVKVSTRDNCFHLYMKITFEFFQHFCSHLQHSVLPIYTLKSSPKIYEKLLEIHKNKSGCDGACFYFNPGTQNAQAGSVCNFKAAGLYTETPARKQKSEVSENQELEVRR